MADNVLTPCNDQGMDPSKRYVPRPHVVRRRVGDECLLLDSTRQQFFSLNFVAVSVWDALSPERTLDEIIDRVADEYGAERDTVERDCLDLMAALLEQGLVDER